MRDPALVQVVGPLDLFADGLREQLEVWGYSRGAQAVHLRLMAALSSWLGARGLSASGLDARSVDSFVRERRAAGCREGRSPRALGPIQEYLGDIGVLGSPVAEPPAGPVETVLADFRCHLRYERGLAGTTIGRNVDLVRPFVATRLTQGVLDLGSLASSDVTGFILACAQTSSPATVQRTGTALRCFLRYLHLCGELESSLVGAVPATANWKAAGLTKYLTGEQVAALLDSCAPGTAVGRRDAAIMRLLSRLGLRAGEVAGLVLEDIDWRRAEITVRGKGNRCERLPLPGDVGEAIVIYLERGRPAGTTGRHVFLGTRAPYRGLTRGAITQIVARASRRCGMPTTVYAHRLRHSAATAMLRAGASLQEIAQVLRHQRVSTVLCK